jgi:hypothetical protein
MRIETQAELKVWLDSNFRSRGALIRSLTPYPAASSTDETSKRPLGCGGNPVKIVCTLQVAGGKNAGEIRRVRDVEIVAQGIKNYFIEWDEKFCTDNPGTFELVADNRGIGFVLNAPGPIHIVCTWLEVLQSPDREEVIESQFSPDNFSACSILPAATTPKDWIDYFQSKDLDVVWRYLGGNEYPLDLVPANYAGWFLQLRSQLNEDKRGLYFSECQWRENRFFLHLYNYAALKLWVEAGKYLATFPEIFILCGNVKMDSAEWLTYLTQFDT